MHVETLSYIGETGRTLEMRIKEHKSACLRADFEKSAVAEHAWLSGHYIEWDDVEVLDQENDLCGRKVKEGIQIRLTNKKRRYRDEGGSVTRMVCHHEETTARKATAEFGTVQITWSYRS